LNHLRWSILRINLSDQSLRDQTFGEIGTIDRKAIDCGAIDLTKSDWSSKMIDPKDARTKFIE
jgi:hypothetical protein